MDQYQRNHHRCNCSGEARMQITPDKPAIHGKILDLSIGGCMIEFLETQPLVFDQKIDLIFCVNNLPFHVLAVVRGERGKARYGFAFPQLRERIQNQLEDLIDELKYGLYKPQKVPFGVARTAK